MSLLCRSVQIEPVFRCDASGCGTRFDPKFPQEMLNVFRDSSCRDSENDADLLVGLPLDDPVKDLLLTRC